ncbi:transforming growth factor beta receptor type 3-like isoform X2 [Antedon mediterranea]|uniref:transforming growth factor beta receptor type 3-like isoform X2 n=1 Tax=Antedon mediterranea TaxID=105859 RepID=UPI003AF5390A
MKLDFLDHLVWLILSISFHFILIPGCSADVQHCYLRSLSPLPLESNVAAYDDHVSVSDIIGCSVSYQPSTSVVAYVLSLTSVGSKINRISDKQSVILNIDQMPFSSFISTIKLVFVLRSDDPVTWNIRTSTLFNLPRILVSRQSTVNSAAKLDVRAVDDLPADQDDLLEWVDKKYPIATYAKITNANHISIMVKQEMHDDQNSTCVVSNDWKQSEVSALFVEEIPIEGCILPQNMKQVDKEVYVIEHTQHEEETSTVTVNLRTVRQDTFQHDIILILKSNDPSVIWEVRGSSIAGSIAIQSNGKVNCQDDVFESVRTNLTFLDHSEENLIQDLEKQYGGLVQYLVVHTANRVEVTLEAPDVPRPPNFLIQDSSFVLKGTNFLEHIIHTQCNSTSMLIAVSLSTLRKYSMSTNDFHLRESGCNATMNDTHMIFKSDVGKCGMQIKSSQKETVYVNEVHYTPESKVIDTGNEELGSGSLPDDEDDSDGHRASISEVRCRYPVSGLSKSSESYRDSSGPIIYKVCTGPKCPKVALQFSVATANSDSNLLATVRSCSVSSLNGNVKDYYIIENGCSPTDLVDITREVNETVTINSLSIVESTEVYEVTCKVAICSPVKTEKHSQCPNRKTTMPCTLQGPVEKDFGKTYSIYFEPNLIHGNLKSETHEKMINGLTTIQVVGIAFAAFLMGIFFVAAIWYIHMHTAIPRTTQEQSSSSQPPPYQPTSNGYAGYRQVPTSGVNGYTAAAGNHGHMNGFGPTINPNGIPMNGMMNSADLAMV